MKTSNLGNEQGAVTYIMVTEAQLRQVAEDGAKSVLEKFGIATEEVKNKLQVEDKAEYRPLVYWMQKLNVNRSTMWRWEKEGLVTPKRVGKKVFFRQQDFDEMFAKRKVE